MIASVLACLHLCQSLGTGNTNNDGSYRPSFLTDQELKHLILEVSNCSWSVKVIIFNMFYEVLSIIGYSCV